MANASTLVLGLGDFNGQVGNVRKDLKVYMEVWNREKKY